MSIIKDKIINQLLYYTSLSFFFIAKEAHDTLTKHEKLLSATFGKNSEILDMIYDPAVKASKSEFDEFLLRSGYIVDWKESMSKEIKNHVGR